MKKPREFKSRKKHHKMVAENHAAIKLLKSGEVDTVVIYATNGATSGNKAFDYKLNQKLFKCIVNLPNHERYNNYIQNGIWFSRGHRMFIIDSYNDKDSRVSVKFQIPIENCVAEIVSMEEVTCDFRID